MTRIRKLIALKFELQELHDNYMVAIGKFNGIIDYYNTLAPDDKHREQLGALVKQYSKEYNELSVKLTEKRKEVEIYENKNR